MEIITLKEYFFESPLLVIGEALAVLPSEDWKDGENWLLSVEALADIRGIVLPLEIKACDYQSRQDLLGVELLNWLRWSAKEPYRYLPILAVAWQSLEAILCRTPNLLLATRGTTFARLPDAVEALLRYIKGVREKSFEWPHARIEDLERIVGGTQAEQISYHDLANDFYAAYRLWEGYKYAVATADLQAEVRRTKTVSLSFADTLRSKLARPAVKEYLASRRRQTSPVYYPPTENWQELLRAHAKYGLPGDTRILMVDDLFDKGLAEVLLQLLFKTSGFSFHRDREWVYSPEGWARLVCVKSVREAACWLKHWREVDVFDDLDLGEGDFREWVGLWADYLSCDLNRMETDQLDEISTDVLSHDVDRLLGGTKPTTVLLLDLHLEKRTAEPLYDPVRMSSIRLWNAVKEERKELRIIVLTASRQAMNYSAIMESAGQSDGWLTKEGPDITLNDEHSSWAALYLLERIHMFSCLNSWYRDEFGWKLNWREEYSNAYLSPFWKESQNHVASESSRIFETLRSNPIAVSSPFATLYENVTKHVVPAHFPVEIRLIARRLAVAALLETAEWRNELPRWDVDKFKLRLNCSSRKNDLKYPNDVLNFTTMLWFVSYTPKLLGLLLREEYEWLKQTFSITEYPRIYAYIDQASQTISE